MKIEIEIPDLEDIYYSYDECEMNGKDLKEIIADIAIEKFIDRIYGDYINDAVRGSLKDEAREIVRVHSKDIVERIVDKVSDEVIRKKSIVDAMPKKSEIADISKEWEDYFVTLIDKAIAKRFK